MSVVEAVGRTVWWWFRVSTGHVWFSQFTRNSSPRFRRCQGYYTTAYSIGAKAGDILVATCRRRIPVHAAIGVAPGNKTG